MCVNSIQYYPVLHKLPIPMPLCAISLPLYEIYHLFPTTQPIEFHCHQAQMIILSLLFDNGIYVVSSTHVISANNVGNIFTYTPWTYIRVIMVWICFYWPC